MAANPQTKKVHADLAAALVLSVADKEWLCAVDAARLIGVGYRPMAFAFRRLVERGMAEERVVTYKGSSRSREERREYKLADVPLSHGWPDVFMPRVRIPKRHTARVVHGRVGGFERWERDRKGALESAAR